MKPNFSRFAVYYLPCPGSPLQRFGDKWLGWSITDGEFINHLKGQIPATEHAKITVTPQKYGFHGTLKPPLRLKDEFGQNELINAVHHIAKMHHPFMMPGLILQVVDQFMALVPMEHSPAMHNLASALVTGLDSFRKAPTQEETTRRLSVELTSRQTELLEAWGYPYVLDEFHFHLTLTGKLEKDQILKIQNYLQEQISPMLEQPIEVKDVAVVGQMENGMFTLIERVPLGS
jgi:putative phosphonate metabolism protein